jgi:hypothetical protein
MSRASWTWRGSALAHSKSPRPSEALVAPYLGILAAALGRTADALGHLGVAVALHERLGTVAWAELSHAELDRLRALAEPGEDTFRLVDGMWWLRFDGHDAHLPDAKGLRDIATLLAAPNRPVHVFTLLGRDAPATRADPMLDRRAVAEFRRRLADLDTEIDEADRWNDPHRAPAPNGTHSWQSCTPRADWPGGPAGSVTRPNVPAKPWPPASATPCAGSNRCTRNWPSTCTPHYAPAPRWPLRRSDRGAHRAHLAFAEVLTECTSAKAAALSVLLFYRLDRAYCDAGDDETAFGGGRSARCGGFLIACGPTPELLVADRA